ncbi:MAG: hypothetical protein ACREOE_05665, partial [Gemmatimonadales bacterium]
MAPETGPYVKEALTSGLATACYYASGPACHVARPDCESLARLSYGRIALCRSCDLRRSAVGRGIAPRAMPDPAATVEVMAARDRAGLADAALADAVRVARS